MHTKEEAFKKITTLVQRFDEQKEYYKNKDYNETQTRRDFIDPFWKALGWDIDNENGYAETYREVIHEDRLKIGSATKAPDYSFKLVGGKRLFFLEAKKPSVIIKDEIAPAYQIRRYGWSAKMPISVISDFEEFAIYDCTTKPKETDKASNGRIKYLTYKEYLNEFDFIWDTFSKERVLKGSFDKYISTDKNKKGTSTVDYEFLQSLDKWRVELAINIALRNKNIYEDELNFIVQHTIDRIIFLRIAEDRSVEPYGELQNAIKSGNFYQNLLHNFHIADQKYNSGLFDFRKDKISNKISIDNKVIKNIISELYYPICPYEFSVLSVEILGSAYEQFLGKQISLSKYGKAIIEEKPEVRKAGGVYYTPQYIVDYIVKNTVGKLIENKTPEEISEIKIADPACGSGSFLIGAYQYLLDWHKNYYSKNSKPSKGIKDNPLTPLGDLTTIEKKRILLNNIYGVDLDSNAVEVTKLSLLLKCMEGETKETIEAQTKLFYDRVLPTLDNNIKSGNSLIDVDYYDNELDFGEERKVKPFSWQKAFPEVFAKKIIEQEEKEIYHVTCVMHNSRVSKRMIEYKVKRGKPEYLAPKEEEALLEILCKIFAENNLTVLQMNLCADHLHFILVCNPNELSQIVGKVKSISARTFNILRGLTSGHANPTSGQAPLQEQQHASPTSGQAHLQGEQQAHLQDAQHAHLQGEQQAHLQEQQHAHLQKADISLPTRGKTQNSLWAQKFHRKLIESNEQLHNTIAYIRNNRIKHNLPELSDSIRALIDSVLTDAEKVFEPTIIKGGFDCIIGNPPYVKVTDKKIFSYFNSKFIHQDYQQDLYLIFLEQYKNLLIKGGKLGIIIPNTWLQSIKFKNIRKYLSNEYYWERILHIKEHIFKAVVDTHVLIFERNYYIKNSSIEIDVFEKRNISHLHIINQYKLPNNGDVINILANKEETNLFEKIKNYSKSLQDFSIVYNGVKPFELGKGKPPQTLETMQSKPYVKESTSKPKKGKNWLPLLRGSLINKYTNFWNKNSWIDYGEWLAAPRDKRIFEAEEKVIVRQTGDRIIATLIGSNIICRNNLHIIISNEISHKFILGILNSKLIDFYYQQINPEKGEALAEVKKQHIEQLPIPNANKTQQSEIIKYVEQLLQLNKDLQTQKLPEKIEQLKNRIVYAEDKINQLVYQLYELTEDEIKIIESN